MTDSSDPFDFDLTGLTVHGWKGTGWRLSNPQQKESECSREGVRRAIAPNTLPDWVKRLPPAERIPPRPLAPSRPDEFEPATRSPVGSDTAFFFRRGLIIHRLLQLLPLISERGRATAAARFLARPIHNLSENDQKTYASEVLAVLAHPDFAVLFGSDSRAEVPVTGLLGSHVVAGQVDRLVVQEDRVIIVDYKSNRPPPADIRDVPRTYMRQMAAYRAVLRPVFPDRRIDCALLWTDVPYFMALPNELLDIYFEHLDA
tara:strand:- start:285 stop:1061 length:777 start_codon:yes stop_codon:yes gene_type:complete